jgi:predicted Zn-dependent protease with MMP-like domain
MLMSATWGSPLTYSYWSLMIRLEEICSDTVDNLPIELKKLANEIINQHKSYSNTHIVTYCVGLDKTNQHRYII